MPSASGGANASASGSGAAPVAVDPLEARARAWNDALNTKSAAALLPLYAQSVRFYTVKTPRETLLREKGIAFRAHPDFHQTVDRFVIAGSRVAFRKEVSYGGKTRAYDAYLEFKNGEIVVEGDQTTDANVVAKANAGVTDAAAFSGTTAQRCNDAIALVAKEPINDFMSSCAESVKKAGATDVGCAVTTLPPEQGKSDWAVRMYEDHPDHTVSLGWIDVDPEAGTVTDIISNAKVTFDPRAMALAAKECAPTPPPPLNP